MRMIMFTRHGNGHEPKLKFVFLVYATRRSMRLALKRICQQHAGLTWRKSEVGSCICVHSTNTYLWTSYIYLNRRDLGSGYVAHEIFHAVICAMEILHPKRLIVADDRRHEKAARLIGHLTRMFWNWWYDDDKDNA